ncbi:hypothetical protein KIN20_014150 [Parelaphostrongylus tenuis]|uniref:Uncharacterized protein n=1 Tax=Parelaphostrongylus tenuis TaxID=148309 RepID=A0AAD5MYK6_PARTN|nr:hypothetical protein KIN20_014150 [Parelaphostrongylus tenuis]
MTNTSQFNTTKPKGNKRLKEKKDNNSEHLRSCNGTDEEAKDYILQQHNQTLKTGLKWDCELEKKAEQAGRNCPKTLTNCSEDYAIERSKPSRKVSPSTTTFEETATSAEVTFHR